MLELIALLLPVAAASGWLAASRNLRRKDSVRRPERKFPDPVYVKGLNYLLNEKSEQTFEFIDDIVDQQRNPAKSQLVLGNLFRRMGEVERAIDIHQGLLSEPSLTEEQHGQAIFELGMDFMRAGLFGRAENIFIELKNDRLFGESSNQQLLQIYQHEKEWLKAIECARKLKLLGKLRRGETISQFFCEMVEASLKDNDFVLARRHVEDALNERDGCVRANLLFAKIEIQQGRYDEALRILKTIGSQDSKTIGQFVGLLTECYQNLGKLSEQIESLKKLHGQFPGGAFVSRISKLIQQRDGVAAAQQFMLSEIRINPSLEGLHHLVALLFIMPPSDSKFVFSELREISSRLLNDSPKYRCVQCGFSGIELHWRCPSCHHWETVVPILEERAARGNH